MASHGQEQKVIAPHAQPFFCAGSNLQDAGCILHEHEPGFGQAYIFTGTHKEPGSQLVLQGCNLVAHSRLGDF